jgi:hypothetical protein
VFIVLRVPFITIHNYNVGVEVALRLADRKKSNVPRNVHSLSLLFVVGIRTFSFPFTALIFQLLYLDHVKWQI